MVSFLTLPTNITNLENISLHNPTLHLGDPRQCPNLTPEKISCLMPFPQPGKDIHVSHGHFHQREGLPHGIRRGVSEPTWSISSRDWKIINLGPLPTLPKGHQLVGGSCGLGRKGNPETFLLSGVLKRRSHAYHSSIGWLEGRDLSPPSSQAALEESLWV